MYAHIHTSIQKGRSTFTHWKALTMVGRGEFSQLPLHHLYVYSKMISQLTFGCAAIVSTTKWQSVAIIATMLILSFVYTSAPLTCFAIRVRRISGAQLINFPLTWGEQRTPGARRRIQFSLCLRKKPTNFGLRQIVCEPFADYIMQVCSPIHTYAHLVCKPFASGSRTIRRTCVYEAIDKHTITGIIDGWLSCFVENSFNSPRGDHCWN